MKTENVGGIENGNMMEFTVMSMRSYMKNYKD